MMCWASSIWCIKLIKTLFIVNEKVSNFFPNIFEAILQIAPESIPPLKLSDIGTSDTNLRSIALISNFFVFDICSFKLNFSISLSVLSFQYFFLETFKVFSMVIIVPFSIWLMLLKNVSLFLNTDL